MSHSDPSRDSIIHAVRMLWQSAECLCNLCCKVKIRITCLDPPMAFILLFVLCWLDDLFLLSSRSLQQWICLWSAASSTQVFTDLHFERVRGRTSSCISCSGLYKIDRAGRCDRNIFCNKYSFYTSFCHRLFLILASRARELLQSLCRGEYVVSERRRV